MTDKFNENLKKARQDAHMTQEEVALADKVDPMALKAVSAFQQTFQVE